MADHKADAQSVRDLFSVELGAESHADRWLQALTSDVTVQGTPVTERSPRRPRPGRRRRNTEDGWLRALNGTC